MNKSILFSAVLTVSTVALVSGAAVHAEDVSPTISTLKQKNQELRKEIRNNIKEEVKDKRETILQEIKDKVKNIGANGHFTGAITAISGQTLTVKGDNGTSYTVNVTSSTKLRRRFWGSSNIGEMSVGDKVNVIGTWKDDAKTQMDAMFVRDASIQKRWGVFIGTVTAKADGSFTLQSKERGTQTVYVDGNTKYMNRKQVAIGYGDVATGHLVRVRGVWDRALNKITEVTQVMDFALPVKPAKATTVTPTVTPTAAPSATPTP